MFFDDDDDDDDEIYIARSKADSVNLNLPRLAEKKR